MVDLEAAADELFGLAPEDFIARRDALARQARADGDKPTAEAIKKLRKPTRVARLANQMAREHPDEIGPLIELGESLREATATLRGEALRQLAEQRRGVVRALLQQARGLARDRGRRADEDVLRELEETFHAALADPAKAERLAQGRLVERLAHTGFAAAPVADSAAPRRKTSAASKSAPAAADTKGAAADARRRQRREELEEELAAAWQDASDTKVAGEAARTRSRQVARRKREAERHVAEAQQQLRAAQQELQQVTAEHERVARSEEKAGLAAQQARRRVSELQRHLNRLKP